MLQANQASRRKRKSKALPLLGAAGLSLSLASGASAAIDGPTAEMLTAKTGVGHEITLCEEEMSDVSLATFYVFDNENAEPLRRGVKLARAGCGCGCGVCRGCTCGSCSTSYAASPPESYANPPRYSIKPVRKYARTPKRRHVAK